MVGLGLDLTLSRVFCWPCSVNAFAGHQTTLRTQSRRAGAAAMLGLCGSLSLSLSLSRSLSLALSLRAAGPAASSFYLWSSLPGRTSYPETRPASLSLSPSLPRPASLSLSLPCPVPLSLSPLSLSSHIPLSLWALPVPKSHPDGKPRN